MKFVVIQIDPNVLMQVHSERIFQDFLRNHRTSLAERGWFATYHSSVPNGKPKVTTSESDVSTSGMQKSS